VEHLRAGGTTPWADFTGESTVSDPLLPGAIQLEVVRRLNLVDGRDHPSHRRLADRVLASSAPGRGQPDLELVGVHDGSPFGPRPVDPAALPTEELLRMAVGVLAELVLERDPGVRPEPRTLPAAPWRRGYHLAGDPQLARHAREALADAGRRPGRRAPVAVLLVDDLGGMLADVWTWRVQQGVTPTWRWWLAHWARRDQLPPRLDLTAVAARWADRVGRGRVHLVVGTPLPGDLLGIRVDPPADRLSAGAAEVVRHANTVLAVLASPEQHQRVLDDVLLPALAAERGAPPAVPARHREWVRRRADRLVEELTAAGYPVHGDLAALVPRSTDGPATGPDATTQSEALAVALRALLGTREVGR
jgi:hypothetical protein